MTLEQAVDLAPIGIGREETIRRAQRCEKRLGPGVHQPLPQRSWKPHLLAIDDFAWKQVLNSLFQHVLLRAAADLEAVRYRHRELDEVVIEKRYAALDGTGHAHLVLLHQQ